MAEKEGAGTQAIDPESFAERMLKAIGAARRAPVDTDDDDEDTGGRSVPMARFREVVRQRNEARAKIAEIEPQIGQLGEAYKAKLAEIQASAAAEVQRITGQHAEDLSLVEGGINDAIGRSALRQHWETLPKEGRGKSPSEWWRTTSEAIRTADPKATTPPPQLPRALQGYLTGAEPQKAKPAAPPEVDRGAKPPQRGPAEMDMDAIGKSADPRAAFIEALKNGQR
jgi:hypothetical protein